MSSIFNAERKYTRSLGNVEHQIRLISKHLLWLAIRKRFYFCFLLCSVATAIQCVELCAEALFWGVCDDYIWEPCT